jgi:hypothetical protein
MLQSLLDIDQKGIDLMLLGNTGVIGEGEDGY